jgi:carboxyl-terminal processing protease
MKKANSIFLTIVLAIFCTVVGFYFGKKGYDLEFGKTPIDVEIKNKTADVPSEVDFATFWQVWEEINNKHVDKPLNPQDLVWGATKGMVAAIGDPYTLYLSPSENTSNDEILSGEYQGIGAELTMRDELVTVVAPFDDSPAQKAGIKPGDIILKVNDEEIFGLNLGEVVKKIKGPSGSEVILNIIREGEEPKDLTLKRDTITLETVKIEEKEDGIVYVRLSRFGEKTNTEWQQAVKDIVFKYPNTKVIVLDLRRNPGGFLGSAVHIASEFMKSGVVVIEKFSNGTERKLETDHKGQLTDKELVILIDEGSASASEILSGALSEKVGAVLVGKKSFGKGSVQEPIDYADGSGLNVTIAKWYTPNGVSIHDNGIDPDHEVDLPAADELQEGEEPQDTQLEKALEIARGLL